MHIDWSWLISSRFDWELQVMFSHRNGFKPTQSLKLWFFWFGNLHFAVKLGRHIQQKAFLHSQAWHQALPIPDLAAVDMFVCVCVRARMCSWKANTKQYYDGMPHGPQELYLPIYPTVRNT